jgi:hypothetical protein
MGKSRPFGSVTIVGAMLLAASCSTSGAATSDGGSSFQVDASWPGELPENWIMGLPLGIAVDSRDHVWVVQNSNVLPASELGATQDPPIGECCIPAPPVMEFDADGRFVRGWGGEGAGYTWPTSAHGIHVDHNDFVWIATNDGAQVLKFTLDGQHVMTIGEATGERDSHDHSKLGGPAGVWVDPETNEAYVADGYRNRRVIVYNGETGEYLRHWGAYGEAPDDEYRPGSREVGAPASRQFSTVHGIRGSRDGLIYVADRTNSRVQVFRKNGEFVAEQNVAPGTLASGGAFDVDFSPTPSRPTSTSRTGPTTRSGFSVGPTSRSSARSDGSAGRRGSGCAFTIWRWTRAATSSRRTRRMGAGSRSSARGNRGRACSGPR